MNKYFKMFMFLAVASLMLFAGDAFAADSGLGSEDNVFDTVIGRLTTTFKNVRTVVFVLGGFGLIGLGFSAIFGKVKWGWVAAVASGLAVVALAGAAVDYVTQSDNLVDVTDTGSLDDTMSGGL